MCLKTDNNKKRLEAKKEAVLYCKEEEADL